MCGRRGAGKDGMRRVMVAPWQGTHMYSNMRASTSTCVALQQRAHVREVGEHDGATSALPIEGLRGRQAGRTYTCSELQHSYFVCLQESARRVPCASALGQVRQKQIGRLPTMSASYGPYTPGNAVRSDITCRITVPCLRVCAGPRRAWT